MNRRSNKKYLIILIILLLGITIGYAALNSTLNINGRSNISKNTWDVHFDNVTVKDGSVEAIKLPTIENNTTVDFEVNLDLPGDFYEFTVDVVNNGTIDAMIDNIEKTPDLTENQLKYINYIIEYQNEEQITTKQLVKSNEFVRIKVRVEYKKDISASDLPKNTETLNLGFNVNYVQSDGSGSSISNNGTKIELISVDGDINEIGTIVTINGTEKFYTIGTEDDNVKLLSMYNLYVGGDYNKTTRKWTAYGVEATGIQDSTMLGWGNLDDINKGTVSFSDECRTDYNGSIAEGYVNDYNNYLITQGVTPIEARLITMDELNSLGCSGEALSCEDAPEWIYLTSYWVGSSDEYNNYVWFVFRDSSSGNMTSCTNNAFGVRPVIVIPKSYIVNNDNNTTKNIIEFTIDGTTYQAEEGMTWAEWEDSIYNTKNILIDRQCGNYVGKNGSINLNDLIENLDVLTYESSAVCGGGSN